MSKLDLAGRRVLVTGASGLLGRRVVAVLSERGCVVHALVREASRINHLQLPNVIIFRGDVSVAETMRPAFTGVDFVVHAAADMTGSEEKGTSVTIRGTQNMLALCREFRVKKLIYISSLSVYGITDCKRGELVDENSPLERHPEKRGQYSSAKLKAEQLVIRAMSEERLPVVCLRPGTFFGVGCAPFTPMMGFALRRKLFVIIGPGTFPLPLVCVENLADAIAAILQRGECAGRIYNVLENDLPTKKEYTESLLKKLYPKAIYIYIPYPLLRCIVRFQEAVFHLIRKSPLLSMYRLESSQKSVFFDASKIRDDLHWTPPMTMQQAYARVIEYETERNQASSNR
jgi:2-alkyl-3-oxoalkanoate reductase